MAGRKLTMFEADVVAIAYCYPAHTGNEVSSCVGGVAERP